MVLSIPEFQSVFDALRHSEAGRQISTDDGWTLTPIDHGGRHRIYRASRANQLDLAVKCYADRSAAEREFGVLTALRDFGVNFAPEPLALNVQIPAMIMGWLEGDTFRAPPALDDDVRWQHFMAAYGVAGKMRLGEFSKLVPMTGKGYIKSGDMFEQMASMLGELDENDPQAEQLQSLYERALAQIPPDWNRPAPIGLCHRNFALRDLLWDGHHIQVLDWEHADWGDLAAEIGFWSAHPEYEAVPSTHWVWVRWEFARLTHDSDLVARATSYGRLAQLFWAIDLALRQDDRLDLRGRYLQRAEKSFR